MTSQFLRSGTQDSRLKTPDSRLPTPDSRLPTPDSRLPTPDSRLPTPDSRLQTHYWPFCFPGARRLELSCKREPCRFVPKIAHKVRCYAHSIPITKNAHRHCTITSDVADFCKGRKCRC